MKTDPKTLEASVRARKQQHGAVLIVSLVILLVLTILGVAGMQNTTMEERMSGNHQDRFAAFQAAEAALRAGELAIADFPTLSGFDFNGSDGTYTVKSFTGGTNPLYSANYAIDVSITTIAGVAAAPQYFIELLPKVPLPESSLVVGFQSKPKDIQYYRVSGRGTGSSGKAEVILQSTYHR